MYIDNLLFKQFGINIFLGGLLKIINCTKHKKQYFEIIENTNLQKAALKAYIKGTKIKTFHLTIDCTFNTVP